MKRFLAFLLVMFFAGAAHAQTQVQFGLQTGSNPRALGVYDQAHTFVPFANLDSTGHTLTFTGPATLSSLTIAGYLAATTSGTLTNGHCVSINAAGNLVDAGGVCGGGGTVSAATAGQLAYYASTGTVVSGATTGTGVLTALGNTAGAAGGFATYNQLGSSALQNIGTGGATVPLLNAANTWSSPQNFYRTSVNPMAPPYNAKCDGVTDDSAALQAAINAAQIQSNSSIGVVKIPAGYPCVYGTTLSIAGFVWIEGEEQKPILSTNGGGSELVYTGTGDGILVQAAGGPSAYTYQVSFKNFAFSANAAATSLIRFHGINGPARVEGMQMAGNWLAASAIIFDTPSGGLQTVVYNNFFGGFTGWEVFAKTLANAEFNDNQFFASNTGGLYLSNPSVVEVHNSYFELMPVGAQIGNETENFPYKVSFHDNFCNNTQSPPIGAPTTTTAQRCLVVKSTANAAAAVGSGSISDNISKVANSFATGPAYYCFEFNHASNTSGYVSQTWEMNNNTCYGASTSGIYNDSAGVNVVLRDNFAYTSWQYGGTSLTPLPITAGAGSFNTTITTVGSLLSSTYSGTGSTGYIQVATARDTGVYRLCLPMVISVAGTGGSFQGWANFTGYGKSIGAASTIAVNANTQWNGTYNNNYDPCLTFHADAGTTINYQIIGTSVTGSPTVSYDVTVEKLR